MALDVSPKLPVQVLSLSGTIDPQTPDDTVLEFVNGALAYRLLNGPSPSGVDVVLGEEDVTSLTSPGTDLWMLVNNQGSVTDIANTSGAVVDHMVYSPFVRPPTRATRRSTICKVSPEESRIRTPA